jgi:hypothetical protein
MDGSACLQPLADVRRTWYDEALTLRTQRTACRLRHKLTLDRLTARFGLETYP